MGEERLGIVKVYCNGEELEGIHDVTFFIPKQTLLNKIIWFIRRFFKRKRFKCTLKIKEIKMACGTKKKGKGGGKKK